MGRGAAYPKVHTDHVPEYISLRNTTDSPSDCPLVTSPLLPLLSGVAHHRFAPHLHSPSCGPSLPFPPPSIPVIHRLPTCSSCIPGLSTTLSSESPQSDECRLVAKRPWDAETASTIQPVCHRHTWGVDQARAVYGRRSDTRPAGARREDIGNTGVRRIGRGSHSLRPHGEQ